MALLNAGYKPSKMPLQKAGSLLFKSVETHSLFSAAMQSFPTSPNWVRVFLRYLASFSLSPLLSPLPPSSLSCFIMFPRMRSKGSRFTLGVWGLSVCSLDVAFVVATVRNRPQPSATVRAIPVWPCLWQVLQKGCFLEVSNVSLLRFAWQAWHFVTFGCVS